jgi:hypothetical protein
VEVTFDYLRFERNLAVFYEKKECKSFLKMMGNKLPVLGYSEKKMVKKESSSKKGQNHIWLQKWKIKTN